MATSVELWRRWIPLKRPFVTALRRVATVEDLVLVLTVDGVTGYGSASPTPQITGDSTERILRVLTEEALVLLKRGFDPSKPAEVFSKQALSATSTQYMVETALYDLAAKGQGVGLAQLLGKNSRTSFISDITISRNDPETMAADALSAVQDGFSLLKIKVGDHLELDLARLRAIAAVIPSNVRFRVDANQAWDARSAVAIIQAYQQEDFPIDLIEQPVPATDLDGLAYVTTHVDLPVMADESIFNTEDARRVLELGAADIINIKLAKCGGITEALRMCDLVAQYQSECMIGCMMEGIFGILAAVQLTAARPEITRVDLDCPSLYACLLGTYGVEFNGERITIGDCQGIGVVDPALESWEGERLWTVRL